MSQVTHVYVHAPFCARRCVYCDFAVQVDARPDSRRWLAAIARELKGITETGRVGLGDRLKTLYLGGGTPSLLDPEVVAALAGVMGRGRMANPDLEWTAEANPESLTGEVARRWASCGVTRISIGVQSFQGKPLRWMGRLHSGRDAEDAVARARSGGVANISVDLMFGLPREIGRCWTSDLECALALGVPHISLYGLTAECGTPLGRAVEDRRLTMPGGQRYREEYLRAAELLQGEGYEHYEVSNFARPGYQSRHNRACWQGAPYLGLGNGAHSYDGRRRWWNVRDWATYLQAVERSGVAREGSELPGPDERRLEVAWLGLRTSDGVALDALDARALPMVGRWERRGWALRKEHRLRLTPKGWTVLDELVVALERWVLHP